VQGRLTHSRMLCLRRFRSTIIQPLGTQGISNSDKILVDLLNRGWLIA